MYPAPIDDYFAPAHLDEALTLVERYGDDAKVIAGGQSLLPMIKLRFVRPTCLVDLTRLSGDDGEQLRRLRVVDGLLEVGALVRHADLVDGALTAERLPILAAVARGVADLQVRNRGTIGGSLAHADHAADYPPVVLALRAVLEVRGSGGSRTVPAGEFFVGPLQTVMGTREILTGVRFPLPPKGTGIAYVKHSAVAGDFAIANACTYVETDPDGRVTTARVAVGGVLPRATLALNAAELLMSGAGPEAAGQAAVEEVRTFGDTRASGEYRAVLIGAAVAQTAREAIAAARKGGSGHAA